MSEKGFKISQLALNRSAEEEGVWFEAGAGLRLLIARVSSPRYEEFVQKKTRTGMTMGVASAVGEDAQLDDVIMQGAASHILLGWENLLDDDENEILYSPEKALELFKEYREFYRIVLQYANSHDAFRNTQQERAAGNLLNSSDGT